MRTNFTDVPLAKQPQPWVWSEVNRLRAADVVKVMKTTMRDYWPVGVRGVYYQVISLPGFRDAWYWHSTKGRTKGQPLKDYVNTVGDLLKWCRLDKNIEHHLPMLSINDDGRKVGGKVGFSSNSEFFQQQISGVFNGYSTCLAQNQERYIEVWVEKQGLFHVVDRAAQEFCRRTFAVRGYPSVTALNHFAQRVVDIENPLILYFGDMDVDGMEIPKTFKRSLLAEHGVNVEVIRCGLNPEQVKDLQADPVGIKGTKVEKEKYISECGPCAFELDAVPPKELEQLVYDSLKAHTDMEILEADKTSGHRTRDKFDELQDTVEDFAGQAARSIGLLT